MTEQSKGKTSGPLTWAGLSPRGSCLLAELPIVLAALALFWALLSLAHYWSRPVNPQVQIDLRPSALPVYALFSLSRIAVAYVISLIFALAYGYIAAHHAGAERLMIPVLDTLQSIPVLCFLPGVMISMVALFPDSQFGLELGSILLIFTGQVWNMAFSVYSSLRSIPCELAEAADVYGLSRWQRFIQLELPQTAIGLIWNSMMAVAAAWFALMVCEMFVLGDRDLRLPGLGSYLQSASNAGDTGAIVWGLFVMIAVIVLIDRLIWRPVIAWSEKFKFEQVERASLSHSAVFDFLRGSKLFSNAQAFLARAAEAVTLFFARRRVPPDMAKSRRDLHKWTSRGLFIMLSAGVMYAVVRMIALMGAISPKEVEAILLGAGATFLRVELTLILAALWTIPAGVSIGLNPKLAAIAQPLAQVAASLPAPALFPIVLMILIRIGGGLGIASIVLLLLGTQWYILFNVIAGASAIPGELEEVCQVFHLSRIQRWRKLLLPAIFPYLITGFVTASGGAWNASIIAEYFRFRGHTFSITGVGAVISRATDAGNFPVLLGATIAISAMVVTINRLLWRPLYNLASKKFSLS